MKMSQCPNGHYFDASIYSNCPYCKNMEPPRTPPVRWADPNPSPIDRTVGYFDSPSPPPPPQPQPRELSSKEAPDEGKTVRLGAIKGTDTPPVVGWLVCIDGPDKGKDFRIQPGMNFIGRARNQDICIPGDQHISREKHARLSFFDEKNSFMLYPGEGHGLVILNGEEVTSPTQLKKFDVIKLGISSLMFVPLCGDGFDWSNEIKRD